MEYFKILCCSIDFLLPNPIEEETNANVKQIPCRMLRVFPVMNQKCGNYKKIENKTHYRSPKDQSLHRIMLIISVHRILAL